MERLLAAVGLQDVSDVNILVVGVVLCAFLLSLPLLRHLVVKITNTPHQPNVYQDITTIPAFDWAKTEPLRIRPYKPKYHLTMAIEQITFSDLLAVDKTYLSRIHWRRKTMSLHLSDTVLALPSSTPLVHELYTYLFSTYLPRRYPSMFKLIAPPSRTHELFLRNLVTAESIPLAPLASSVQALHTISAHIDTDFLLLSPQPVADDSTDDGEDKFHLVALANCTPSGFAPAEKLGLPLAAIHRPVPGYAAKLEKSMDRYFAALPRGKVVLRANWSVTTDAELFNLKGNHFKDDEGGEEDEIGRQRERVKVQECRLRVERQTLHRLERTGGICFAFKTYLYPLEEVKAEGEGEALADAIEGLGKGTVPEMRVYKREIVWGDKAVEYLRDGKKT